LVPSSAPAAAAAASTTRADRTKNRASPSSEVEHSHVGAFPVSSPGAVPVSSPGEDIMSRKIARKQAAAGSSLTRAAPIQVGAPERRNIPWHVGVRWSVQANNIRERRPQEKGPENGFYGTLLP
jgi:hypothetical protein